MNLLGIILPLLVDFKLKFYELCFVEMYSRCLRMQFF
jgi:hypothetical protein